MRVFLFPLLFVILVGFNTKTLDQDHFHVQFEQTTDSEDMEAFVFPNPVVVNTLITYDLAKDTRVVMNLYDCQGRMVRNILDEDQQSGSQRVLMERDDLAAGLYFLKIKANDQVASLSIAVVD